MVIHCPYCGHGFPIQIDKPGRFGSRCPQCTKTFAVTVPAGPNPKLVVTPLKSEVASAERGSKTEDHPAATVTEASRPPVADQGGIRRELAATPNAPGEARGSTFGSHSAADATRSLEPPSSGEVPSRFGGYRILRTLGRGRMGVTYLARKGSLARNVVLKVMGPQGANDPVFVSRYTREAYAAAQLVHPNLVQVHDFGKERGTQYVGVEFVDGQPLSELLGRGTKLDPEVAAVYILQAARGLKFAHDHGLIHHAIKPEKLILSNSGIVKVADLGLVETMATEISAYVAPEQAHDPGGIDARTEIYALGCTLHALITGRPPSEVEAVAETAAKHATGPIGPPEAIDDRVPEALREIVRKIVARKPEDRYANIGEVIKALEEFLGVASAGTFMPLDEQAQTLEVCIREFHEVSEARLRRQLILGSLVATALLVLISLVRGHVLLAGGFLGLTQLASLFGFILRGHLDRTYLYLKARALVLGGAPGDWLVAGFGLGLFVTLLVMFHWLWVWILISVVAVVAAVGFHYTLDRPIAVARDVPLARAEAMLKELRLCGQDEDALRQFVCTFGGERWEEFFEALFGYEAKLAAREQWGRGTRGRARPRFAPWREPIVARIEARLRARREASERALLQRIEERSLVAQGVNLVTARRKAHRSADAMVTVAGELRASSTAGGRVAWTAMKAMIQAAERPDSVLSHARSDDRSERRSLLPLLDFVIGPRLRFLVGGLLVAGCLAWMDQNGLISRRQITESVRTAAVKRDGGQALKGAKEIGGEVAANVRNVLDRKRQTDALRLSILPASVTGLFHDFGSGVAGLILLVSSLYRGTRIGLIAIAGAVFALLGPRLGLPSIGPVDASDAGMALGVALLVLGVLFGGRR